MGFLISSECFSAWEKHFLVSVSSELQTSGNLVQHNRFLASVQVRLKCFREARFDLLMSFLCPVPHYLVRGLS